MTKHFVFTLAKIEKNDVIQKAPPKFDGAVARYRAGRDAMNRVSTNPDGLFYDEFTYSIRRLIAHADEIHTALQVAHVEAHLVQPVDDEVLHGPAVHVEDHHLGAALQVGIEVEHVVGRDGVEVEAGLSVFVHILGAGTESQNLGRNGLLSRLVDSGDIDAHFLFVIHLEDPLGAEDFHVLVRIVHEIEVEVVEVVHHGHVP